VTDALSDKRIADVYTHTQERLDDLLRGVQPRAQDNERDRMETILALLAERESYGVEALAAKCRNLVSIQERDIADITSLRETVARLERENALLLAERERIQSRHDRGCWAYRLRITRANECMCKGYIEKDNAPLVTLTEFMTEHFLTHATERDLLLKVAEAAETRLCGDRKCSKCGELGRRLDTWKARRP